MIKNTTQATMTAVLAEVDADPQLAVVGQWLNDSWDGYDAWGSLMAEGFAVCDYLVCTLKKSAPSGLGYQPSPFGADDESPLYQAIEEGVAAGELNADNLTAYAEWLDRALDAAKDAGLDY